MKMIRQAFITLIVLITWTKLTQAQFTMAGSNGGTTVTTYAGKVGIGTANPLDNAALTIKNNANGGWQHLAFDGNTDDWFMGTFGGGGFFIAKDGFSSSSTKFTIRSDGKIGIGTNAFKFGGNFKLYVNGGIRGRHCKVDLQTDWGDYVFEPTYQLPTLREVEAYIKTNKHLPGVPSATTLEKEGLDLGEMQTIQMVKIEELTLYTIQLKKENDALKQKMKKYELLAKRLEKLEKMLEKK